MIVPAPFMESVGPCAVNRVRTSHHHVEFFRRSAVAAPRSSILP